MTKQEFIEEEFPKLAFFTDRILKVHGGHHPELAEVRELFVAMKDKTRLNPEADVTNELTRLAQVTNNYEVPEDACEGYRTTYQLLQNFQELSVAN
ncbi:hypothetical protein [Enterococcus sp. JM9B]|uniref:hypothetical protein n=1 Tax=Enterococcus sp. JM9B TaxID=1857216 RepID=UPI001374C667|nr:hypothetical protein [Enterococcus sp. JM9B]KAF1301844.1 hypothetical protein BAU16_08130 [Enterococcus sp. JM9B]